MRRSFPSLAVLLVALLLASCGSGTEATEPSVAAPAATAAPAAPAITAAPAETVAPTTAVVAIDYGAQYLSAIEPFNCALARLGSSLSATLGEDGQFTRDEWPQLNDQLREAHASFALSVVETIESFASLTWPSELNPDIAALLSELSQLAQSSDTFARAGTVDDWVRALEAESEIPNTAATIIRAKLGLETNVGVNVSC